MTPGGGVPVAGRTSRMASVRARKWSGPPIAVFWDQSLPWGLLCVETLTTMGVPFHLITASDITCGWLNRYRVLLVPGGWASHKVRVLGEPGAAAIKDFVQCGGSYLGFCGGAGLALASPPSIGLVSLERLGPEERLPSASGEVWIGGEAGHPVWKDLPHTLPVSVWWPSQFSLQPPVGSMCLGVYSATGSDFMVADLPVGDFGKAREPWEEWERIYGINLNPGRIMGHPALVETHVGKGRLILSYPHLETPGDEWGNRLLLNCLTYLDAEASRDVWRGEIFQGPAGRFERFPGGPALVRLDKALAKVDDLISFGERHLFWRWRRPWLLQWTRGIRGLEYSALAVGMRQMHAMARETSGEVGAAAGWLEDLDVLGDDIETFCNLAKMLLILEKVAGRGGGLPKLGEVNEGVDELRDRLFGKHMNHGGLCKALFDRIEGLILDIVRLDSRPREHLTGSTG